MLELPLHHCYITQADTAADCVSTLTSKLKDLFATNDTELTIAADVVETLDIELARGLRQLGQQQAAGEARCIIRGFDTITTPAQNALLKIIESPAEGTHFFFVTAEPASLLPTVRSRAYRLDICGQPASIDFDDLVADFTAADSLPDRLSAMEQLGTTVELRRFVRQLAKTEFVRKQPQLGHAVEQVADWSRDSGASIKLLGQYLAIAADSSSDSE